jgi:hypothetical protein
MVKRLIEIFSKQTGVGFISFPYENKQAEKSRRIVNIGLSYANAKTKDLKTLVGGVAYIPNEKYSVVEWNLAIAELKESCIAPDSVRSEGQQNAYIPVTENGSLKWNITNERLYIFGQSIRKTITEEIEYKAVKSSAKTIAKNVIKKNYLSTGKLRSFIVDCVIGDIKINGDTIEIY